MTSSEDRVARVQAGSRRKRDKAAIAAAPERSAEEKYLAFFADWRKRTGSPHSLEAAWRRDNPNAAQAATAAVAARRGDEA